MRVNPNYMVDLVSSLDGVSGTEQRLSRQISSGARVSTISDDPIAAGQNFLLSAQMSQDDTFLQSASSTESLMQITDSTLGSVITQLTQAVSVATSGSSGTANTANMNSVAQQLSGIRDEVLSLANTSYLGRHIFAGSQGGNVPFSLDTSSTPAVAVYTGDSVPTFLEAPNGQKIQTNLPGAQVFTAAGADVLNTLNTLIADFSSGNLSAAQSSTSQLSAVLGHVSTQRASLDTSIQRLQAAGSYTQNEQLQLNATQTNLMQADIPALSTSLSLAESQRTALEAVIVTFEKQGTLFNLLQ